MVKILHLYPNLMNLYGDYANITVLKKHLEDQGLKVSVEGKELKSKIDFKKYDLIYMGSGSDSNLLVALNDLRKYRDDIVQAIDKNKVILFTGNAMEVLGNSVIGQKGLGIFDFDVELTNKRYTGDVIANNDTLGNVVGFINKGTIIKGGENSKLFDYEFIDNNLKDNTYEGCHKNNLYGTHIIGPVLVKNPGFMKAIVKSLLPSKQKYKNIKYKYEEESYTITYNALKERNNDR